MKSLIFALASILFLQSVSARAVADEVALKSCDDILSTETCDKLRNIAQIFHEKAGIVNEAVRAAVAKHLTKAQDIINFAKNYLVQKATNFKCEDVSTADTCDKLRNIAQIFHEKAGIVNEAVKAAVANYSTKAQDIITFAKNYLVQKATNFKCEDVFTADQCAKLVAFAAKFQVSVKDLTEDIKEAVATGIAKGQDLYRKTEAILLEKLSNLSCDQLMDAETCQKIVDFAKKIHASSQEVKEAIIDAYTKGLTNAKDFLADVERYLKEEISCDKILGQERCSKLRLAVKKIGIKFDTVMEKLKEAYANGIQSIGGLYNVAIQYIKDNWWPFGFSNLSEDEFSEILDMMDTY